MLSSPAAEINADVVHSSMPYTLGKMLAIWELIGLGTFVADVRRIRRRPPFWPPPDAGSREPRQSPPDLGAGQIQLNPPDSPTG
jgi:hypothetical protein